MLVEIRPRSREAVARALNVLIAVFRNFMFFGELCCSRCAALLYLTSCMWWSHVGPNQCRKSFDRSIKCPCKRFVRRFRPLFSRRLHHDRVAPPVARTQGDLTRCLLCVMQIVPGDSAAGNISAWPKRMGFPVCAVPFARSSLARLSIVILMCVSLQVTCCTSFCCA
jgi:hypothetical protein